MNEINNNDWNVYCQVYGPKQEADIRMLNEILAKEDEDDRFWIWWYAEQYNGVNWN